MILPRLIKIPRLAPFNPIFLLGMAPALSILYLTADNISFFSDRRDFAVFWSASVLLWRGELLQLFDPATFQPAMEQIMDFDIGILPFAYPPHSLLFFAPLSLFPFLAALAIWLSLTFGFLLAVVWRWIDHRWVMAIGLILSPASAVNVSTGQNGFLSAALLCGGLLLMERRPILAGILFGLLSYKPQLGLLIPVLLLTAGHWRVFWVAAVTVIVLAATSAALLGLETWELYLTKTGPQQLHIAQFFSGRFQFMVPTYFMAGRLLELELWQSWALQIVSTALAMGASVWVFRQRVPHRLKAAVAMVAVFLVSPYVMTYDMLIINVAILLAAQCFAANWKECIIFALPWLLPAFTFAPKMPLGPLIMTTLFLVLLRRVSMLSRQEAEGAPTLAAR